MSTLCKLGRALLLSAGLLPALGLAAPVHAQDYACEAPVGTNCRALLSDAYRVSYQNRSYVGVTNSSLVVLPGACNPGDGIVDLDLSVEIVHPYVGDLELQLTHPDGTSAIVLYRPGIGVLDDLCPSDDLRVTLDDDDGVDGSELCSPTIPALSGELLPFNPLSVFDGKPRNGTWNLTVRDDVPGKQGVLMGWTLHLPCVPDLPDVNLDATDGLVAETGDDDSATVTVTRGGSTDDELEVRYAVMGTASLSDFEELSGSVTIPAGDASATVDVHAIADDRAEAHETVVLTLLASDGYEIGARDSATVTLIEEASEVSGGAGTGGPGGGGNGGGGNGARADAGDLDGGTQDGGGAASGGGDSGCGCRTVGGGTDGGAPLAALGLCSLLGVLITRRRRTPRS